MGRKRQARSRIGGNRSSPQTARFARIWFTGSDRSGSSDV